MRRCSSRTPRAARRSTTAARNRRARSTSSTTRTRRRSPRTTRAPARCATSATRSARAWPCSCAAAAQGEGGVKLAPARIAAFLAKPDAAMRAALVYGPDAGLVRERADRIAAAICPDLRDAFRVADVTAAALLQDPARLNDEAAALSLTGGRRVLRVRDAGDAAGALFERFLAAQPPGGGVVGARGGQLGPRSSLRRALPERPRPLSIPRLAHRPR